MNLPYTVTFSDSVEVWMLHKLGDQETLDKDNYAVATKNFEDYLAEHSDEIRWLSPSDLHRENYNSNRRNVLLTADDAWRSFHKELFPLLQRYEIPVLLFVTPAFLDDQNLPYEEVVRQIVYRREDVCDDTGERLQTRDPEKQKKILFEKQRFSAQSERGKFISRLLDHNELTRKDLKEQGPFFLRSSEIKELSKRELVTVGAHGLHHLRLRYRGPIANYREIVRGKDMLEKIIDQTVNYLAYPYGSSNPLTRFLVWLSGVRLAFGTGDTVMEAGERYSMFNLPRRDVSSFLRKNP